MSWSDVIKNNNTVESEPMFNYDSVKEATELPEQNNKTPFEFCGTGPPVYDNSISEAEFLETHPGVILVDPSDLKDYKDFELPEPNKRMNLIDPNEVLARKISPSEHKTSPKKFSYEYFYRHCEQHVKNISKHGVCVFITNPDSTMYLLLTDFGKYEWNTESDRLIPFSGTYKQWCKFHHFKRGKCIGFHKISTICGENILTQNVE